MAGRLAAVAIALVIVSGTARRADSVALHVDCELGSDALGDGSAERPWQTPLRARDAVRAMQPLQAHVDVFLAGDCVPRRQGGQVDFTLPLLELVGQQDSGTRSAQISYRSYPGQAKARLLSGRVVQPSAWKRVGSSPIFALNLTELGIDSSFFGGFQRPSSMSGDGLGQCLSHQMELFYDGEAMTLARYPNLRFANGSHTPPQARWARIAEVTAAQRAFVTDDVRALRWAAEPDGWLHGYWGFDWADSHLPIRGVHQAKPARNSTAVRARISVAAPVLYGFKPGAKFYGVNLRCELDAPGEYYVDKPNSELLFWPPSRINGPLSGEAVLSLGDFGVMLGGSTRQLSAALDRREKRSRGAGKEDGVKRLLGCVGCDRSDGFGKFMEGQHVRVSRLQSAAAQQGVRTGWSWGGVSNVQLVGLDVMYQRRSAVVVVGGKNITLDRVTVV